MSNQLETWGNADTMNLNAILYQNILASNYFKSLYDKKTYDEIVNEIYNEVNNLSPFLKGTNPSTAFCCLFKLWTLRLTVKQLEKLIDHPDSPFIRAIGFLYLRYVCDPKQLWDWLGYYIDDEEEIDLTGDSKQKKSTIGSLCRLLLTEMKYQGTMLPRIPVPIARDLEGKLAEHDRENGAKKHSSGGGEGRSRNRSRSPARRDRDYKEGGRSQSRNDSRREYQGRSRSRDRKARQRDDGYRRRTSRSPRRDRGGDRYRTRSRSRSRSPNYRRRH